MNYDTDDLQCVSIAILYECATLVSSSFGMITKYLMWQIFEVELV